MSNPNPALIKMYLRNLLKTLEEKKPALRAAPRFDRKQQFHLVPMALDLFKNQFVMPQIQTDNFKFFQNTHA